LISRCPNFHHKGKIIIIFFKFLPGTLGPLHLAPLDFAHTAHPTVTPLYVHGRHTLAIVFTWTIIKRLGVLFRGLANKLHKYGISNLEQVIDCCRCILSCTLPERDSQVFVPIFRKCIKMLCAFLCAIMQCSFKLLIFAWCFFLMACFNLLLLKISIYDALSLANLC